MTTTQIPAEEVQPGTTIDYSPSTPLLVHRVEAVETPAAMRAHGIEYHGVARTVTGEGFTLVKGETVRVFV